jgi:Transcription factor WhiB
VPDPIPAAGRVEWLTLTGRLEESPPVPCRVEDPAAWWPDKKNADSALTRGAVAACRRCPVAAECLSYALAADERFGVWGGTLPEERRQVVRQTAARPTSRSAASWSPALGTAPRSGDRR